MICTAITNEAHEAISQGDAAARLRRLARSARRSPPRGIRLFVGHKTLDRLSYSDVILLLAKRPHRVRGRTSRPPRWSVWVRGYDQRDSAANHGSDCIALRKAVSTRPGARQMYSAALAFAPASSFCR